MKIIELTQFRRKDGDRVALPCVSAKSCDRIVTMLPQPEKKTFLDIDSFGGVTDVYLSGICTETLCGNRRKLLPVSRERELGLRFINAGTQLRRVRMFTASGDCYILPYGVYAYASNTEDKQATVNISVDIACDADSAACELEVSVYNKRGKRITSRKKKVNVKRGQKTYVLAVKLRSVNFYSATDPYIYTAEAKLSGECSDEASAAFGVRGDEVQFSGAYVAPDAGLFGGIAAESVEEYKLNALKSLGYDAVRFSGCPSENALIAADRLGMRCIVDIFDNWSQPKGNTLAHAHYRLDRDGTVTSAVRMLRAHPSVIMYCIGNCVDESYGRADKTAVEHIVRLIKSEDPSRIVTAALGELTPTAAELELLGASPAAIREAGGDNAALEALGRECDLFNIITEPFAVTLDAVGLTDISGDGAGSGKPVFFAATSPERAYELNAELERCGDILGDIADNGVDCPARNKISYGDLDFAYNPRTKGLYRQVAKGKGGSFIAADCGGGPMSAERYWNFPHAGGKVRVYVYTQGDVVALYLNGRLVGRKLAGRINDFIASFDVGFEAGRLEAVCFTKGKETDRCVLETTGAPRSIKLTGTKTVTAGGIAFVQANVCDKEGRISPYPDCEIRLTVDGGRVIALGSGRGAGEGTEVCTSHGGRALIAIRTDDADKLTVKAESAGLTAGRLTVKIK